MNVRHLKAILWLRWRLGVRRFGRSGPLMTVVAMIVAVSAVLGGIAFFAAALGLGLAFLDEADGDHVMLVWSAAIAAFLFFWIIGVVTDLKRIEALSLDKLLHLPISLRSAFALNYVTTLATPSLIIFLPPMLGFTIALVIVKGPAMLFVLPLLASFLLMITAVTYQLRGWLAALMMNKRRRGTIIAISTVAIIGVAQLPQLFNIARFGGGDDHISTFVDQNAEVREALEAGEITPEESVAQFERVKAEYDTRREERRRAKHDALVSTARTVTTFAPPGWLAVGSGELVKGAVWPALLGTLGALAISFVSLERGYRTTLRIYTGAGSAKARKRTSEPKPLPDGTTLLVERRLPFVSDRVSSIAFSGFRMFVRSPQIKMVLLTPIILLLVFGSMFLSKRISPPPDRFVPLIGFGVVTVTVVMLAQLIQNTFAIDRDGFRVYVLSPAARHEVLMGKNLAIAPFAALFGAMGLVIAQIVVPMRLVDLAAAPMQLASIYLMCCMMGNVTSIIAPLAISSHSLKLAEPKMTMLIKQMLFLPLLSFGLIPVALPLLVQMLLWEVDAARVVPISLLGSVVVFVATLWLYTRVVRLQGRFLQRREQWVLEQVTRDRVE